MKPKFHLLILLTIIIGACKQKVQYHAVKNIGDDAPPLRVQEWVKGTPVPNFEKGKVYVIEFWATWCKPCIASMPHLSVLAHQYKGTATFIAIDVMEQETHTSIKKVKAVVEDMGNKMDFPVATEDSNFMAHDWVDASGEHSIPSTFVVNENGKVAWIGHPKNLDKILPQILNHTWDIKKALSVRILNENLKKWDLAAISKLGRYGRLYHNNYHGYDHGKPDSMLLAIDSSVKKDPRLKYAPFVASYTFAALLETNPRKAYEYGKQVMITPTYEDPAYSSIIGAIRDDSSRVKIPAEIYRLGAECYQAEIDGYLAEIDTYGKLADITGKYHKMAAWYKLAGDKSKAVEAEQKAVQFKVGASANKLN